VESTYLPQIADQQKVHKDLATFFAEIEGYGERKLEELPWQLEKSGHHENLKECMLDLNMFYNLYVAASHKFDLFRYWRTIGEKTKTDIVTALSKQLDFTDKFPHGVIVGDLFYKVGNFFEEIGKYEGSVEIYQKARHHFEASAQNLRVAKMEYTIARVLLLQAKYVESEILLQRSLSIVIREKGEDDAEVATVLNRLGALYTDIGKFADADNCLTKALRIRVEKYGPTHARVGQVLKHMLSFYEAQGNISKAMEVGNRALAITEQAFGPDDLNISDIVVRLGRLYMAQKKFQEAKYCFKRALHIVEAKLGPTHPKAGDNIYELGCFYYIKPDEIGKSKIGKSWSSDKAETWFTRALQVKQASLPSDHPEIARVLNRLGSLCIERTEYDKAESYFRQALESRKKKLGPSHPRVAQTLKHMITLFELQEKYKQAIECSLQAFDIYEKMAADEGNRPLTEGSAKFGCVNILIRIGEQYKSLEGWKSENPKKYLTKALERQVSMTSPTHPKTLEIIAMIEDLKVPPPPPLPKFLAPPPPPPPCEAVPPPPKDANRSALFAEIMKKAQGTKNLKNRKGNDRQNRVAKEGWWKQNYAYELELPVPPSQQQKPTPQQKRK
jgi:tetratricopeptide (TPR) repeat protein